MARTLVKNTGKSLKKSAQVKAITKTAKGTRKSATKAVKASAIAKTAKTAAEKAGDRTRTGAYLGIGAASAAGGALFLRRRRRDSSATPADAPPAADAPPPAELNDPALARKVESEIFRPADAPKDSVNVNVEHGVVYLRGQVESREQVEALEAAARAVDGIERVENLLHAPGEEVPAKRETHDSVERPAS